MKKITSLFLIASFFVSTFSFVITPRVEAAGLNNLLIRPNDQTIGVPTTDYLVVFTPVNVTTATKVVVTELGKNTAGVYAIDGEASAFGGVTAINTTTNIPADITGIGVISNAGATFTYSASTATTVTITATGLTAGQHYAFYLTGVTNPTVASTTSQSNVIKVETQDATNATIDIGFTNVFIADSGAYPNNDEIVITANVLPQYEIRLDANTSDIGTLTAGTPAVGLAVTATVKTNAANGNVIWMKINNTDTANTNGLASGLTAAIPYVAAPVVGTAAGFNVGITGNNITITNPYLAANTEGTFYEIGSSQVYNSADQTLILTPTANAVAATPAGVYSATLTVIGAGNF